MAQGSVEPVTHELSDQVSRELRRQDVRSFLEKVLGKQ